MRVGLRIVSIAPSFFYVDTPAGLRQLARLELENPGDQCPARLVVQMGAWQEHFELGLVPEARSTHDIHLPDITSPARLSCQLWSGSQLPDETSLVWQPGKKWEVHLVHYSHHDLGYTDLPSRVIADHIQYLDDVLQFCEQTRDWPEAAKFRWQVEQGFSLVEFIENRPPERVERLMAFVRDGQIEVTALFANQILELCSHEELVRLLYPSLQLREKYGIPVLAAAHNDIPGFSWGLASLLAAAGVRYFVLGMPAWYYGTGSDRVHPLWDEEQVLPLEVPGAFWWQGPDGRQVLLWYNLHGLNEWAPTSYQHCLDQLPQMLAQLEASGYSYDQVMYTVRGGERDNAPPTLASADLVKEWSHHWAYPRLVTSTFSRFLVSFQRKYGQELKTLRGDVPGTDYPVGAAGTPRESAVNRRSHDWLMTGEKLATLAWLSAHSDYPKAAIDRAYRNVIYFDEHCWGTWQSAGPALEGDWSEKSAFAYRGAVQAYDVLLKAANQIADQIAYPQDGYYLTVFNALSWERSGIVRLPGATLAANLSAMHWKPPRHPGEAAVLAAGAVLGRQLVDPPISLFENPFELVDCASGQQVPYQLVWLRDGEAAQPWAASRFALGKVYPGYQFELVFLAGNLPAMGYKTYRLAPCDTWPEFDPGVQLKTEGIENAFYDLRFDSLNGLVTSLVDRQLQRELLDSSASHALGQLIVRSSESGAETAASLSGFSLAEHGPVYTSYISKGSAPGCPQCIQEIVLYHGIKCLEVNTRLLRDASPMLELYFAFPFQVDQPRFHFEAPGAVIEPLQDQLPGTNTDYYALQHWAAVDGGDWGVSWTSRDAHLVEFGGLWPGYVSGAHHGVTPPGYGHAFLKPGAFSRGSLYSLAMYNNFRTNFINVQPGEAIFRYALTSRAGDWQAARAWQFGWNVMNPPLPVCLRGPQVGSLALSASFCQVDASNVMLVNLKRAQDARGVILRLVEVAGQETLTTLSLPYIIIIEAYLTDPVEQDMESLEAGLHSLQLLIKPHSITTLRLVVQALESND